jgi:quercetin dioxygenase-like cupin family protein
MPVLPAPSTPTHDIPGARFTTLASPSRGSAETSVWRLELLPGAEPVPHTVTREEIFVALDGEALATLDGVDQTVLSGDTLVLPVGVEFRLVATGAAPFRALVCLPVGGQAATIGGEPFTPPWAE